MPPYSKEAFFRTMGISDLAGVGIALGLGFFIKMEADHFYNKLHNEGIAYAKTQPPRDPGGIRNKCLKQQKNLNSEAQGWVAQFNQGMGLDAAGIFAWTLVYPDESSGDEYTWAWGPNGEGGEGFGWLKDTDQTQVWSDTDMAYTTSGPFTNFTCQDVSASPNLGALEQLEAEYLIAQVTPTPTYPDGAPINDVFMQQAQIPWYMGNYDPRGNFNYYPIYGKFWTGTGTGTSAVVADDS